LRTAPPGIETDDRYRTVPENQIVDMLLVAAFVYEIEAGERDAACARIISALDNWIRLGLGHRRTPAGQRMFDPVEVINFMKWSGYQGLDNFWINHFVATTRAFFAEWSAGAALGPDGLRHHPPARFAVDLHRFFDLSGIEAGQKLRLRLPLPISQLSDEIEVEPMGPSGVSARISRSEGRLDFQFAMPSQPDTEIAARISFTTSGRSKDDLSKAPASVRETYLRDNEGLIRITPRIKGLSEQLSGAGGDQLTVATRLFHHVIDELMCGLVHYDQVNAEAPGDWVLNSGWYDCQLGSALFASLCRARGLPARILSGHMMYRLAPGFHYWTEIWIDGLGWVPFDFLTWDLSKAGRDEGWRHSFVGTVDYRLVTQCFPLTFTGPMSIRFPPSWHLVNAPFGKGMEIRFTELSGKLIYCDRITCQLLS
jgi:Transglutaminase-like superfamily